MGECVTLPLEDISFATYVQCHSGIGADGIAQLCSLTKCCCTGGTGTVGANTQDWYWGNDPTLESDHGSNVGLNLQKLKLDQAGLTPSKKDQLVAQSSKTPTPHVLPQDPPRGDTLPHHLCHLWQRNTTLLKARTPIPAAQWPSYWHNFNKVSTVNH